MTRERRTLGQEGERLAAEYLEREGYRIIERNVRAGGVELDLVACRGRLRVFVEVKTRRSRRHGPPEAAVDRNKQARIARGAAAWLREHRTAGGRARFDVITVEPDPSGALVVRHWPGAFESPGGR